ncbi:hypothetical protein OIU77_007341 [Salix suchowensis]|uniref:Uncharacterized protein n=1 Tax=Salix suchowensis TaxID=1278906 RepID=A0ABQ9AFQ5_9ROSI|nr:hypothetical protein OIU77_007341 [Salix suchowensis]
MGTVTFSFDFLSLSLSWPSQRLLDLTEKKMKR